ncbi:sulfurtransferase TusA family protein [Aquipuribacter sp. MA13-6]|uniref:sulfurtransferase TusA family protein n=1 Tax=unclassified Aquipuribacter TaxID=2635084 RepID=UPI003EEF77B8
MRGLPAGTTASVRAEDPAVEHDVPAWAGMRGHEVLRVERTDGAWLVVIRTGGAGGAGRSSVAASAGPTGPPATGSGPG